MSEVLSRAEDEFFEGSEDRYGNVYGSSCDHDSEDDEVEEEKDSMSIYENIEFHFDNGEMITLWDVYALYMESRYDDDEWKFMIGNKVFDICDDGSFSTGPYK